MQGIEYNIAALRTIIFIIYVEVALLLPMEDQMYVLSCSQTREEGIGFRFLWALVQYMLMLF